MTNRQIAIELLELTLKDDIPNKYADIIVSFAIELLKIKKNYG